MYTQLTSDLYLHRMNVEVHLENPIKANANHIWIYDRSASMTNLLPQLINDLCHYVDTLLRDDDVLTLAWFSTEGKHNVVLKGVRINTQARKDIKAIIRDNSTPLNLTCFSEVLMEINTIVTDTKIFNDNFSFMFFTDGYPVVSNYNHEIKAIYAVMEQIAMKVSTATIIGYGQYYNRSLLNEMANRVGGTLYHADSVADYQLRLESHISGSDATPKKYLNVGDDALKVFYLYGSNIVVCPIVNSAAIVPVDVTNVFVINHSEGVNGLEVSGKFLMPGVYASAVLLSRDLRVSEAVSILSKLGDVYAVDLLNDAWSNSDYGHAEDLISEMILEPIKRFTKGLQVGYKSDDNRFCLLDLLDKLQDNAKFYPYDEEFKYQRIGLKTNVREGFPKFTPEVSNPACPFASLTWHDTRLNLSIKTRIDGTVNLGDDAFAYNLFPFHKTNIWRTYTLVNNGFLNVFSLPVSSDYNLYVDLEKNGVVTSNFSWLPDDENDRMCKYVIDLRSIPIINKSIENSSMTAVEFCRLKIQEYKLEARNKVLRHYTEKIVVKQKEELGDDQQAYLESRGVKSYGFAPPVDTEPATDYYMTREFKVTAKGLSSFPKVEDVLDRIKANKVQTTAGELMKNYVKVIDDAYNLDSKSASKMIMDYTVATHQELAKLRSKIQRTKFTILLAKKWFPDLDTRDGAQLDVDGFLFTFNIGEVKETY